MSAVHQLLPDPRFEPLHALLEERLQQAAAALTPEALESLLDPLMRHVLNDGLRAASADEGTLWLVDQQGEHLAPAFNNGPHAALFVNQFRQPLNDGLICMVFATQQPFIENAVAQNARQSKLLDRHLQVITQALLAVPFILLGSCRGVISCVRLEQPAPAPAGRFSHEHLLQLQQTSQLLSRLLELKLLSQAVGWKG